MKGSIVEFYQNTLYMIEKQTIEFIEDLEAFFDRKLEQDIYVQAVADACLDDFDVKITKGQEILIRINTSPYVLYLLSHDTTIKDMKLWDFLKVYLYHKLIIPFLDITGWSLTDTPFSELFKRAIQNVLTFKKFESEARKFQKIKDVLAKRDDLVVRKPFYTFVELNPNKIDPLIEKGIKLELTTEEIAVAIIYNSLPENTKIKKEYRKADALEKAKISDAILNDIKEKEAYNWAKLRTLILNPTMYATNNEVLVKILSQALTKEEKKETFMPEFISELKTRIKERGEDKDTVKL